ncbi:MAG TPA: hypothetical protein VGM57_13315 [Pseudolabrys sp.]|jgi:hypothetical protein
MAKRIFVLAALVLTLASNTASAAIWEWRCQGQLGDQQVVFNRESLAVIDSKKPLAKIGDNDKIAAMLKDAGTTYEPGNGNDGLVQTIEFTGSGDNKHKIVLTEKSSRRVSHRAKLICGRDETTDIFRTVYSFQRDSEPPRDITMQCLDYQLSTRGGRKGCD